MKLHNLIFAFFTAGCMATSAASFAQSSCTNAYEPNNTIGAPAYFPVNSQLDAAISSNTDVDYYRVDIPSFGVLSVTLANLSADLDLELLSTSGSLIASSRNRGTTYESINWRFPGGPATYILRVTGYNGAFSSNCYRLFYTFLDAACSNSYEPNETSSSATTIATNTNITDKISSSTDVDWYKFTTTTGNTNLQIFLNNLEYDYDIELYAGAGGSVASSSATGNRNEVIVYNTTSPGTYYLRVSQKIPGSYNLQCYTLRVNTGSSAFTYRLGADPNDVSGVAATLGAYPNPAVAGGEVFVSIPSENEAVSVRILDARGAAVSEQKVQVVSGTAKVNLEGIEPGIYFIEAGTFGTRKLVVE